ncbi:MAG: class B sortase [Faecousia sp.]
MKKMNKKKVIYYTLLGVFLLVFLFSAGYLLKYMIESRQQNNFYENLSSQITGSTVERPTGGYVPPTSNPGTGGATDPSQEETKASTPVTSNDLGILDEYYPIYQQNTDMVGWIQIEGTVINYPVMQTPEQKDYYLKHNFEKKWSAWGCIYAREACDINAPSDNITLYGHHMKDGSMFSGLDRYWYRENWEAQPFIYFDTLYEYRTYQIFAMFLTSATPGEGFAYHVFSDANTAEEFDAFIAQAKELSMYDTGITPVFGDQILTLSTCYGADLDYRYVVMAVRVS